MRVFAVGRLYRYPGRTWERSLARQNGRRVKRARDADLIVFGASAATRPAGQLMSDLGEARQRGQQIVSERGFLRRLRLIPPLVPEPRSHTAGEVAAAAKLTPQQIELLALFDVIEAENGNFGFRALQAARQAGRLLQQASLADLVFATCQMRQALGVAEPLSELQVTTDAEGRIALRAGDRLADPTGQLRLGVWQSGAETAGLIADADAARADGDTPVAEQLLRRALAGSPRDLDALFELGSLLCESERFAEGLALLRKVTYQEPGFADAWYNIGHAHERRGRHKEARDAYERAIAADADYADPLFNLGMIDLEEGRFSEAIERLTSYLALDAASDWAAKARKGIALARLSQVKAAG